MFSGGKIKIDQTCVPAVNCESKIARSENATAWKNTEITEFLRFFWLLRYFSFAAAP
jgi:hypothetical protein